MNRFIISPFFKIFAILLLGNSLCLAKGFQRVILDPGHGGKDKGALWGGVRESDLNLKVAKKIETLLKARGIPVTMTRQSDQFISITKRAQICNQYRNAILVSIHFNASRFPQVSGVETYYASASGKELAKNIHSKLLTKLKVKDRHIRQGAQYAILNKTNCPAVLVECGYISNNHERQLCNQSWYQSLAASAITDGIMNSR